MSDGWAESDSTKSVCGARWVMCSRVYGMPRCQELRAEFYLLEVGSFVVFNCFGTRSEIISLIDIHWVIGRFDDHPARRIS